MRMLSDVLDFYVKSLKSKEEFKSIKFVFAGKTSKAPYPLEEFLVACSVGNASLENLSSGKIVKATLCLDVYAHKAASKRELSVLCHKMASALQETKSSLKALAIEVSQGVYDSNFCVWRQQITMKLQGAGSSAASTALKLCVNGKALEGVSDFREVTSLSLYPVREFLASVVDYVITDSHDKTLLLTLTKENHLDFFEEFTLSCEERGVVYEGCKVSKLQRKSDGFGDTLDYTLVYRKKVFKKEVEACE